MQRSSLGVGLRDFRLATKESLRCAARLGFGAVEIHAVRGDTRPEALSESGRRHLARWVGSLGMRIAALDADAPGGGLADPACGDKRIAETKAVLELARDLRVPLITTGVGAIRDGDPAEVLAAPLRELADHADRTGTLIAFQPGDIAPETLSALLRSVDCPSLCVCVDPGLLIMNGCDPVDVIAEASGRIHLSHARDAIGGGSGGGRETELGDGQVDFVSYLAALDAAGYAGPQIIRRSGCRDAVASIARAKAFLESRASPRT